MKKLNLYIIKSYLGPFVFTFFIALFILLLQFLWKYIDDLVGKGLEWYIIAKLMFYASSTFVPLALPLAVLLSSLMTFGNLGEHYELVAIGFVIRVGKKAKDNKTIYDVKIYNHSKNQGNLMVTTAESGTMQLSANQKNLIFTLYNGYRFTEITNVARYRETRPFESVKFEKQVLNFDLSQFQLNRTNEDKADVLEIAIRNARAAKKNVIDSGKGLEARQTIITKHEVVWHQKFKLSIACFIFFFIGAPLGAIIRKGGLGLPVVVSVIFFVLYHVVSMLGEKAVKTGEVDVVLGLWLSTFIVLPLGFFLTYKATTDAQLMDTESWGKFFKIFKLKKKIDK